MSNALRPAAAGLVALLALSQAACLGRRDEGAAGGALSVVVTPANLSIPAGGGGAITVSVSRALPRVQGSPEPLSLSLDGAPAGLTGSGTIPAGSFAGTLLLQADAALAPQAVPGLRVRVSGLGASAEFPLNLTIAPALPPGQIRADLVQAGGGLQRAGTLANAPMLQEPVAATTATDGAQVQAVRHGFDPTAPSAQ